MDAKTLTGLQTEFYGLEASVKALSPKIIELQASEEQDAFKARMAGFTKRQQRISKLLGLVLDGSLARQRTALDEKYLNAMSILGELSLNNLINGCERIANLNKQRIALYGEIKRCAAIAGRARPAFPRHAGILNRGDIVEPEKIEAAFLSGGQVVVGRGQMTSRGAQA